MSSVQSAQLLSQSNRILDVFLVSDAETKTAISEERWPGVKEKILAKLTRRKVLNSAVNDPKLVEQVSNFCKHSIALAVLQEQVENFD